jgi:hypothetical protein
LADALESVLPDIPDHDARRHKLRAVRGGPPAGWLEEDRRRPLSPLERHSGSACKEWLKTFIAFLRSGGVRIWWENW